ncbi:MAG: hypothetical protein PHV59_07290 [Victivallales bacterium]|nr:hypothetical protein [Victivallales bacterium]
MKKITTLLFSLAVTVSGTAVLAGCPMNKPGDGCRQMHQEDEIDKLLMLVTIQEMKPGCQDGKFHPRKMMDKERTCPMAAEKGRRGPQTPGCPMMAGKDGNGTQTPGCPGNFATAGKDRMCMGNRKSGSDCMKGDGFKKHRHGGFHRNARLKACLMENYPKEMAEIINMKKANDQADKELLGKFKKLVDEAKVKLQAEREKMQADREEFRKMLTEYKQKKDDKLAEKIKVKIAEFYDKRLEGMKKHIDADAARVQKAYDDLKTKTADKDKEVAEEFARFTK